MGQRLGIIAGSGAFPLQAVAEAGNLGYVCVVAGLRGAADEALKLRADAFEWIGPAEIAKLVAFFKDQGVREAILVGKVEHRSVFRKDLGDEAAALLAGLRERTPTALLQAVVGYLEAQGIAVKDPAFLLRPHLCPAGVLGGMEPGPDAAADVEFGWPLAKRLADLDIGQTIVVKGRAVVAVEGMEGTDETIARSLRLAGPGVVVIKVGRTRQDTRFDVPAVGLATMRALVRARAAALAIEAGTMPFFQRDESLALADANGIAVIAR
jgi:hypothetical protein